MGIKIFEHQEFGKVRILIDKEGAPWFVARDVALALGYADPDDAVRRHCKSAKPLNSGETPGFNDYSNLHPRSLIIPESDVYQLVFGSKLPAAERFRDWVCGELLPTIRETGQYVVAEDSAPATIGHIRALDARLVQVETGMQVIANDMGKVSTILTGLVERISEVNAVNAVLPLIQDALDNQRVKPKPFGDETKSIMREAALRQGRLCPCCGLVFIVGERSNALPGLEYDHWSGASNSRANCWPVCRECNQHRLKDWSFRQSVAHRFRSFQDTVALVEKDRAAIKRMRSSRPRLKTCKKDFQNQVTLPGFERRRQ